MRYLKMTLLTGILLATAASLQAGTKYFTAAGATIALLDSTSAAKQTLRPDEYTRSHTPFDLQIRLNKATGLTEDDYLRAAAADVQNWPAGEQMQLEKDFGMISAYLQTNNIHLHLPDTIELIKTHAKVEFGAEGWTRKNRIMLHTEAQPISVHLLAHELFHVLSRHDEKTRNDIYAVFHFKPCNNIVYKPAMRNRAITNPDCPFLMHYIRLDINGQPQDVALMLYSKNDYKKEYTMNDYMQIGLLALTGDDLHKAPLLKDGAPVIYGLSEVPDLFKQIGTNTEYILHVEEISAEHFAALVSNEKMRQPEYTDGVLAALKKN